MLRRLDNSEELVQPVRDRGLSCIAQTEVDLLRREISEVKVAARMRRRTVTSPLIFLCADACKVSDAIDLGLFGDIVPLEVCLWEYVVVLDHIRFATMLCSDLELDFPINSVVGAER